jgi:DNA invertase Pin-like site-specific DNA recombinase
MSNAVVAYYRVSPREQGKSGLGIDAQRAAVARFVEAEAFDLVAEFTDVETGKGADALDRRPQLAAALVEARRHDKAPVMVAKWSAYTRLRDESRVVRARRARYRAMMKRTEDPGTIHRPTKIEFTYSD